jgi:diadenosine tetraphosphatase ApaH/serine/threonine PP2A family protein phosphatase
VSVSLVYASFRRVSSEPGAGHPFELLWSDPEKDEFWQRLVEQGLFPESPMWITREGALRALATTKAKFAEQLRQLGMWH